MRPQIYLASPVTSDQANSCKGLDVLLSYVVHQNRPGLVRDYAPTFSRVLVDSGAFSVHQGRPAPDLDAYVEWALAFIPYATAYAGLDDVGGDIALSWKNYRRVWDMGVRGFFPSIHDSDPPEALEELVAAAREYGGSWLGLGLVPPRTGEEKRTFVRETLERIPDDIHVHGFACVAHIGASRRGFDSVDSTTWFRHAMALGARGLALHWLTPTELVEIEIKRTQRADRLAALPNQPLPLFDGLPDEPDRGAD